MNSLEDLLEEYKESLRKARIQHDESPEVDKKIHSSIVRDLEYVVKWLENKQEPVPPKSRITMMSDGDYIDMFEFDDAFNFNGCPYKEVERRIDKAIRRNKNDSNRRRARRIRRERLHSKRFD